MDLTLSKSVPLGKYILIGPLVLSLVPLYQGAYESEKYTSITLFNKHFMSYHFNTIMIDHRFNKVLIEAF